MNEPDLTSPNARLARAEELLVELNAMVIGWQDSHKLSTVVIREGVYAIRADFDTWPVIEWAVLTGDIVANLRGTLDHMIYALVVAESGQEPPPNAGNLGFPNSSREKFNRAIDNDLKIGELRRLPKFRKVIEEHQWWGPMGGAIGRLTNLDNQHKHQLIHVAVTNIADARVEAEAFNRGGTAWVVQTPLKQNGQIATLVFDDPVDGEWIKAVFRFTLSFADDPTAGLVPTLRWCRDAVKSVRFLMLDALGLGHLIGDA